MFFTASTPKRVVIPKTRRMIILTDITFMDHTELDRYFHVYYKPDYTMPQWREMVHGSTIQHRSDYVALLIGNNCLPVNSGDRKLSPKNQMRKLLQDILKYLKWVKFIFVCAILPRADNEVLYEQETIDFNTAIASAVRLVKSGSPAARKHATVHPHTQDLSRTLRVLRLQHGTYCLTSTNRQTLSHLLQTGIIRA